MRAHPEMPELCRPGRSRESRAFILVTLFLGACGGTEPELGVHTAAVVGGKPEPGHDAVGRVLRDGSFSCTGTLIGANKESPYVLTAAHCLLDLEERRVYPVGAVSVEFIADQVIPAKILIPHEKADPENYQNDIGLILLEHFPQGVRPAKLAVQQPITNMPVTVMGYGATETAAPGTSLNRAATSVEKLRDQGYNLRAPSDTGGLTGGFCGGDSGGPTFTDFWGEEMVIGVHSAIETTVLDPPDGKSESSDTFLCKNRSTFDVMVASYLADNWLYEKTDGNIVVDTSVTTSNPADDPAVTGADGDDVRAVVCGLNNAPPSTTLVVLLLAALVVRSRRLR